MHIVYPVVISALLFSIGVYGVLARRNTILVLMSVELMLNAVNLNLVAFDVWLRDQLHGGQVLTLFTIVIAAAEIGLGLAIVLLVFRNRATIAVDALRDLTETDGSAPSGNGLKGAFSPLGGLKGAFSRIGRRGYATPTCWKSVSGHRPWTVPSRTCNDMSGNAKSDAA